MKIDKIRWTETKMLLKENYRTQKEIAALLGLGESTVQRINSTGSYHEYRAVSKAQHKVVTDSKSKWKFWTWFS